MKNSIKYHYIIGIALELRYIVILCPISMQKSQMKMQCTGTR